MITTSLLCSGLSHRTAPLALRERLSFPPDRAKELLSAPWFRAARTKAGVSEIAVLSTCNRTEFHAAVVSHGGRHASQNGAPSTVLAALLARAADIPLEVLVPHLYTHAGTAAIRHLCRVAAGLDSMVIGEAEVLGQVGEALGHAIESGSAGPVLDAAFHTALRAGRRARTETAISRRPAGVAGEAARLIRDRLPLEESSSVLVLGAGTMGRSVARVLNGSDRFRLRVTGRNAGPVHDLAAELGVEPMAWDALESTLSDTDAVIAATAAPEPILTAGLVTRAWGSRESDRPRLLVDVAVPRNIDPSVRGIPGVELYDLDDLHGRIDTNLEARRGEVPLVEVIVEQEVAHFDRWRRGSELRPVLTALREKAEMTRRLELDRFLGTNGDTPPELRKALDDFSRDLVSKLLHDPSRRLREDSDPGRARSSADLVRELFDLPIPTGSHALDAGSGPNGSGALDAARGGGQG